MSVIGSFFNKSKFSITNLTTNPKVVPDELFEFNFYIYDALRNGTAKSLVAELIVIDGRSESTVTNTPSEYVVDYNVWQMSAVVPAADWNGTDSLILRFSITDITDSLHLIDYVLHKKD